MNHPLFRAQTFPVEDANNIACIITGFGGKITHYEQVIQTLNKRGFSVVGYQHSRSVLLGGDPYELIKLVDEIYHDFSQKAAGYQKIICVGVSAGAGLCFSLQKRMPAIQYGIYAGAGASGAATLKKPLFFLVRRKLHKHGFSDAKLERIWKELDISADDPPSRKVAFVMALGTRDKVIKYEQAVATLRAWQKAGVPIKIITQPNLGHLGVIAWHKEHIDELLVEAERLTA